jgi:hypothetical protein
MSRSFRHSEFLPAKRVCHPLKPQSFHCLPGSSIPSPIWSSLCTNRNHGTSITQKLLVLKCSVRMTDTHPNSQLGSPNQRTEMAEGGG